MITCFIQLLILCILLLLFEQSVTGYFNECSDVARVCYKLDGTRLLIAGKDELPDGENVLLKVSKYKECSKTIEK